jgi:hypothetical protein
LNVQGERELAGNSAVNHPSCDPGGLQALLQANGLRSVVTTPTCLGSPQLAPRGQFRNEYGSSNLSGQ